MKALIVYLKLYWKRFFLVSLVITLAIGAGFFFFESFKSFFALESFSRNSLLAQMGFMGLIFIFVNLLTVPIMVGMQLYFMQGGGLAKLGKQEVDLAQTNVKWNEVIGMDSAKREAWELVQLLRDRAMVKAIGGKIIKGTLMIGPPGCGKTYLAKAIATECKLPLVSTVGSEFVGIFIGLGAAKMKSLFKQARVLAEMHGGCIIFIDEIDSFARPRQADRGFGGQLDHNATINQFLTELDGLRKTENTIVVLAATNVPENELDEAIMRAGRFDRKIHVTRPNLEERKQLFEFYLSRVKTEKQMDCEILARKALWFSPSDIDSMIREAGLIALRENRVVINMKDLSSAYDRVTFGMKANITLSRKEKTWTAYHEAGHAVIAYLTHPTDDVIKASIIPHKGNLGFVFHTPMEERHSSRREDLLAEIKVSLASYVAERLKFGSTSSGVGGGSGSDFDTAMRHAHNMVWYYGMGKSGLIGDFHALRDYSGRPAFLSEKTKEILDNDVQDILQTCLREVEEILRANEKLLEFFAEELIKKEELEYDEIEAIFKKFGLQSAARQDKVE